MLFTVMLLMKNHAINQSTQLEYGVENYDTEVVDCDYNAEVEYSACLISMFCLNYVIALLSRLKNPSMGTYILKGGICGHRIPQTI